MIGSGLIFRRFTVGSYPINGYLVADAETRIGVFVDPGGFQEEIATFIEQNKILLRHVFFTHGHWDHTEGLPEIMERYSVQCYAGRDEVRAASHVLYGGETINIGRIQFTALHTPGHTAGGKSYYCRDRVFTGDALFCGSVGGTSSEAAAQEQIEFVRKNIFTLPDRTLIYPAHGPMTTVAAEKYANPFFR
jgi:glyoxylase-like metal-dependent hydrolase (beta-lactamase superfamily II)